MVKKVKSESWKRGWEPLFIKKMRELVDGAKVFEEKREKMIRNFLGFEEKGEFEEEVERC